MKNIAKLVLTFLFGLIIINLANAAEFVVKGAYNGKNLYIHNPHNEDDDFCITEFYVNGVRFTAPKSSALDVDLSHLLAETNVTIKIVHTEVCEPKLMNANVLRKNQEFHFAGVEINKTQLSWVGKGEHKHGVYFVESFKNDSWHTTKVINAKGAENNYSEEVAMHTGVNKFRVRYVNNHGKIFFSNEAVYFSNKDRVKFAYNETESKLTFTAQVRYEVQDENRNTILKGNGETVDCAKLKNGVYYMVYDNQVEKFSKTDVATATEEEGKKSRKGGR